jgi:hypothetical protein
MWGSQAGPLGDMLPGRSRSEFGSNKSGTQHAPNQPNLIKKLIVAALINLTLQMGNRLSAAYFQL